MSETYEQLRDSASGEAGEAWKAADRGESNLRTFYRELKEDPRFTSEHKSERAWAAYEATTEKIAADKVKARETLEKQARTGEYFSFPMPEGESLIPSDTSKLLASQNESSRLIRKLDRMAGSGGPFKPDKTEVLRSEYERGLRIGGVQGGAICRGVLEAADELGLDRHQIVDGFRKQSHRNSLEDAERALMRTQLIGKQIQEPPFQRPSSSPGRTSGGGKLLIPRGGSTPIQTKRRPSWR